MAMSAVVTCTWTLLPNSLFMVRVHFLVVVGLCVPIFLLALGQGLLQLLETIHSSFPGGPHGYSSHMDVGFLLGQWKHISLTFCPITNWRTVLLFKGLMWLGRASWYAPYLINITNYGMKSLFLMVVGITQGMYPGRWKLLQPILESCLLYHCFSFWKKKSLLLNI